MIKTVLRLFEDGMFKPHGKAFIGFVASQTNPQREQGPHE